MTSENLVQKYKKLSRYKFLVIGAATAVLITSIIYDVMSGPANYSIAEVIRTLFNKEKVTAILQVVVWDVRFPVASMAFVTGIMLSVSGAQMQTLLNNPLADPFTLGISSAASFGAALAIVLGKGIPFLASEYLVIGNAFIFAFSASLFLYFFAKVINAATETITLIGIAMMFAFGSLLLLLQYGASENELTQLTFWMMGSLGKASWGKIQICVLVLVIVTPYFISKLSHMTALRLGDEKARSMGINVERLRLTMLCIISLLTSISVAFIGTVGFVGLVGPHIARMLLGEDQRYFLPMSALVGGVIMSLTSILSKSLVPGVIFPIGIITSLVGIPFFVSLILTSRKKIY